MQSFIWSTGTAGLCVFGLLLLSCSGLRDDGPDTDLQFDAVVQHRDLEGGVWVLRSEDGTTYDPGTLPEVYREEGLRVRVWANRLDNQMSFRMVGPLISLERIERRE